MVKDELVGQPPAANQPIPTTATTTSARIRSSDENPNSTPGQFQESRHCKDSEQVRDQSVHVRDARLKDEGQSRNDGRRPRQKSGSVHRAPYSKPDN